MADTLSQSEIDALLSAVSSGSVPAGAGGDRRKDGKHFDWVAYDLASQEKFLRGRLAALEGIHERFCRLFRATLINAFGKHVSVTYKDTEILRFSEYLSGVTLPTSLGIVESKNPPGHMLFVVNAKLAYALVDGYYGGSERPFSQIGVREEFTTIETNLIEKVMKFGVKDLMESWKPNYPIELDFVSTEPNPVFVSYIPSAESVAIVNFDVEFENSSGSLCLILHLRALDPIRQFLSVSVNKEMSADKTIWRDHWLKEVQDLPLHVRAHLGRMECSLKEMSQWKVGQVLTLDQDPLSPIALEVEGITKFKGQMGVYHGSSAIKISNIIKKKG